MRRSWTSPDMKYAAPRDRQLFETCGARTCDSRMRVRESDDGNTRRARTVSTVSRRDPRRGSATRGAEGWNPEPACAGWVSPRVAARYLRGPSDAYLRGASDLPRPRSCLAARLQP